MKQVSPLARSKSLVIKELPDETLVYDRDNDKAHCLNSTAALVWKNCDGKNSISNLRDVIEKQTNSKVPDDVVLLALEQLEKFDLLDHDTPQSFRMAGMKRRDVIRRVGFAALALPIIVSITAPEAMAQGSLLPPGRCCGNPTDCTSNSCVQGGCIAPPPPQPSTKVCA